MDDGLPAPGTDCPPRPGGADGLLAPEGSGALWKLASWLSPAYPVGGFAYSHGLEQAIAAGDVADPGSAAAWIADCIAHGAGRSDAILLAHAWRAEAADDPVALEAVAELAAALAPSAERLLETAAQGAAFAEVTSAVWDAVPGAGPGAAPDAAPGAGGGAGGGVDRRPAARPEPPGMPYPVAVGRAAARHGVPLQAAALLFLHAFASTLASACVRLVPLGQADGQRVLAALMTLCQHVAGEAVAAKLDEVGGCAFRADIAAMRHETLAVRLFRT